MVNKKTISLFIFSLVVVLIAGYLFQIQTKNIVGEKSALNNLQSDLAKLDRILADKNEIEARYQTLSSAQPASYEEVALFISILEDLASKDKTEITLKIDENSIQEKPGIESVKIQLKSSGSYAKFKDYLKSIAKLPYHLRFDSMQLDKSASETDYTVTFRLFIQPI